MGKILIEGMKFYSYHGVLEEERIIGNHFSIDVELDIDIKQAGITDDLNKTADYTRVHELVKTELNNPVQLIETLAFRISEKIKKMFVVNSVLVKVTKFKPPVDGLIEKVSAIYNQ